MKFDEESHRSIGCDVVENLWQHDAGVPRVQDQFTTIKAIEVIAEPP